MKKKIENFFKKNNGTAFKSKEIAKRLNLEDPADHTQLKSILYKLYREDFLIRKGKRFQINLYPDSSKLQGILRNHPDGYGFVIPKNKKLRDIFISERNIGTAFDGDTVEVVLFAKSKGKNLEGQIKNIIKRKRKEILGTLHKTKSFYFIVPDDFNFQRDIYVDKTNLNDAKVGDKVIVGKIEWDTSMLNPEGVILEVLGKEGSADVELTAIARRYNLRTNFPAKVLSETNEIKISITDEEVKKRMDLRKDIIFTIDPEDAKDYDDALSIKVLENGNFKLGVHIADVSHFVPKGSALDSQARLRGNSVYLVGKVIPMLPEKISNGVCSLVPHEDRFTYSVLFEITRDGKIVKYDIVKSIINSKRRFTYEEVQEIIESGKGEFYKEIIQLNNFAKTLRQKRIAAGSIEFSKPEVVFELDDDGNATAIIRKEVKESNMLVEEFMLLANKTIARHLFQKKKSNRKSFVYRVHDKPDQEKIEEFSRFVNSLGFTFNKNAFKNSKEIQRLISQVKDLEENAVINELAIRSMAKAVYTNNNIGHFGLGFKYYTHFTSPIRRYADLLVHRLVYTYGQNKTGSDYSLDDLSKICDHISICERNAVEAERRSVKIKQVDYLKNKIGEEFHAVISGVTYYGLFIQISSILADGLIRVRDLEGDFYVYDEKKYSLIGKHKNKSYRLGDKVVVKLIRVDVDKLELDFITVE